MTSKRVHFSLTSSEVAIRVIIAGGSGFIGRELTKSLTQDGHEVIILSRTPAKVLGLPQGAQAAGWDARTPDGWDELTDGADVIINLAGENLKGKGLLPHRWTRVRKQIIRQSRREAGAAVVQAVQLAKRKPGLVIQASAVGFYGPHGEELVTEQTPPGDDFLARVCQDWEDATVEVERMGIRRVILRTGLPLSLKDGAFPSLLLPFRLFVGNSFGNGRQFYPWIHIEDHILAIRFLIDNPDSSGPYNLSAPNPVTNREFAKTLGKATHRPSFFPIPRLALEIAFGEVSTVVMDGQKAIPARLMQTGFEFRFPTLEQALVDVLKK